MKINKICIFIILIVIVLSSYITQKIVWNKARLEYNTKIDSIYARIVSEFSKNKEKRLLRVSSNIVSANIIDFYKYNIDLKYYTYLCAYMNEDLKNTLFTNSEFDKKKIVFAYNKINKFCKKYKRGKGVRA